MDQSNVTTGQAATPMPKYRCFKEVWALKIKDIQQGTVVTKEFPAGSYTITPEGRSFAPFDVSTEWFNKHTPSTGGYYVQYQDGYTSYSPAKAFEEGYRRIHNGPFQVDDLVNFSKASGNRPLHDPVRVAAMEMHNGDYFYRLEGFPGCLWLGSSLTSA